MKVIARITTLRKHWPYGSPREVLFRVYHTITYNEVQSGVYSEQLPAGVSQEHGLRVLNNSDIEVGSGKVTADGLAFVMHSGQPWVAGDVHTIICINTQYVTSYGRSKIEKILRNVKKYDIHGRIIDGSRAVKLYGWKLP
jgi:hypothetical protein